ncbi:MAG: Txe/YoeB family addiction module toxin [Flavobacterium sp.]|jgi:toxin YoeB|uniref:Putative mRNA interferase YoeB n=1 Tax=Flavobacterium macrobrachii TaxID=591204 RepID=A0ABS2CX81_9FLAO|nr:MULTISPECIES: Txe/YoeB family addiction module toxin [Flavobacterium]MBM6499568.1 Txe/YoeB family addiction module toxin [Flavobacterium macrobrachii]MCZ8090099.1 Txe/YoeB family addiction module toxin [Flavobacterium sp.]MCZ8330424.1 Txe/YoeB family addiction module toxin [Flavobacterium sp.]PZO31188.1 MAG: Txe/YoeB family addiction module toxin [Flavobacteriaceae bacterium]
MGKFKIIIEPSAELEIKFHLKSGNKAVIKKLEKIFVELEETPYSGIGNPEALKHDLSGYWSRRLSQKDRLIYRVEENIVTIFIIAALGHYSDK